jgi:hypothetical protein
MATREEMEALKGQEVLFKWIRPSHNDFYYGSVLYVGNVNVYFDPLCCVPIAGQLHEFELRTGISTVPKYPGFFRIVRQAILINDPTATDHCFPYSRIEILEVNR